MAERVAIDSRGEVIRYVGDAHHTARPMIEGILAMEEEHADDPASLLQEPGGQPGADAAFPRARGACA